MGAQLFALLWLPGLGRADLSPRSGRGMWAMHFLIILTLGLSLTRKIGNCSPQIACTRWPPGNQIGGRLWAIPIDSGHEFRTLALGDIDHRDCTAWFTIPRSTKYTTQFHVSDSCRVLTSTFAINRWVQEEPGLLGAIIPCCAPSRDAMRSETALCPFSYTKWSTCSARQEPFWLWQILEVQSIARLEARNARVPGVFLNTP
jgi:hypothetical protein